MLPEAERWARIKEVFASAADLPPEARAEFLEQACEGDSAFRREVESLLSFDSQKEGPLDQPALPLPGDLFPESSAEFPSDRPFGPYRLIREIGRGGLGVVYLAQRADDAYRKEVAIKLIRRGLDTEDILRRFRNERQILAQLEHPNIARLLDGGTTEDGLPFFVMEFVKGEPLLDYCDAHRLTIEERLELFCKICAAVTYAHQNLVIHRDLKPSNILVIADSGSVREQGEPKLLDFGIARLLSAEDEDLTLTAPAARVLTLGYASPEQIRGGRLTTSSDIYSLGVILYELLTGQKPHRIKSGTSEEMAQAITEQEPERPSTAAARRSDNQRSAVTDAEQRPSFPIRNQKSLRGDLDNIVLMALRKEPERRYISAAAFADDIERYLTGRPVIAHHATVTYRASKFVRRHQAGVLATVLLLLAILAGITGTLWQSRQANLQRTKAEKRFDDVRKLANSNLFEVYPEVENLAGSLKARGKILQNALHYLDSLAKEAGGDLDLQSELATGYEKVGDVQGALNNSNLGNTRAGLQTYRKATALRAAVVAARPNDLEAKEKLARNGYTIARTLWMDSQTKEAEEEFEKTLGLQRALVAAKPDSPELKDKLAVTLIDYAAIPAFNSQSEKALTLLHEALAMVDQLREKDPANLTYKKTQARLLRQVGHSKDILGDYAGGLEAFQTALILSKEAAQQAPDDFRAQRAVWLTECMTCEHFIAQGNGAEAVRVSEGAIEFPKRALEKEPENGVVAYDLAISYFNLARAYRLTGNFQETITNADAALGVMSKLSAKSPDDADYKRNLAIYKTEKARAQIELRQSDEALAALREAAEIMRPIVAGDPNSATSQGDLGMAYRLQAQALHQKGDDRAAAGLVDKAIEIAQRLKLQNAIPDSEKDLLAELEAEKAEYSR